MDQQSRPDEAVEFVVLPQYMAHVLAQKAFDALSKFLRPLNVFLINRPSSVGIVGFSGLERFDPLLRFEIPRDVGHEVFRVRKRLHWLDGDRLIKVQIAKPRHAHELRHSVNFSGARTAFSGLAVPSAGQVRGRFRLDLMNCI